MKWIVGLALALSAAGAARANGLFAEYRPYLAGASVAVDGERGEVWVADSDNDAIAVSAPGAKKLLRTIAVAGAPEQIAIAPDGTAYVTLRDAGEVAAIAPGAERVTARAAVGLEPYGIALAPDGKTIFVTVAGSAEVVALDGALRTLGRVRVDPEPRGLAMLADGTRLVVSHLTGRSVSVIELIDRYREKVLSPPTRIALATFDRDPLAPHAPPGHEQANLAIAIAPSPDRARVFVPHAVENNGAAIEPERRAGTYGGGTPQPVALNVSTVDVDAEIALPDRDADERAAPAFVPPPVPGLRATESRCLGRVSQPSAAVVDGRFRRLYVAGFGSDDVTAFDTAPQPTAQRLCVKFERGSAPKGLAVSDTGLELYVHLAFRHELVCIHLPPRPAADVKRIVLTRLTVGRERLSAAAQRGRRIFYSAGDDHQSADGHLPCGTCHPDGRHDGLVWRLDQGPRQTPILAGRLYGTSPYNWRGTGATLHANFVETTRRLGGAGLSPGDLSDLELFVTRHLKPVPVPAPEHELVERGRALFASEEVGCAHCHDPARRFTDGRTHDLGTISREEVRPPLVRLAYKTPSLLGVRAGAPYLHDGSAASLRELLTTGNPGDRMGRTSQLAPSELDALVAYLTTL